jgi:hypothetical protein
MRCQLGIVQWLCSFFEIPLASLAAMAGACEAQDTESGFTQPVGHALADATGELFEVEVAGDDARQLFAMPEVEDFVRQQ